MTIQGDMQDHISHRAMDAAIADMEEAFKFIVNGENITLPQYRRLKKLRHVFADFLVRTVRTDGDPERLEDRA